MTTEAPKRYAVIPLPGSGWCDCCGESWRQDMIAVRVGDATICGDCLLHLAGDVLVAKASMAETRR